MRDLSEKGKASLFFFDYSQRRSSHHQQTMQTFSGMQYMEKHLLSKHTDLTNSLREAAMFEQVTSKALRLGTWPYRSLATACALVVFELYGRSPPVRLALPIFIRIS